MNSLILMAALVSGQCEDGSCRAPAREAISWHLLPRGVTRKTSAEIDEATVRKPLKAIAETVQERKPLRTRVHQRPLFRRLFGRLSRRRCR